MFPALALDVRDQQRQRRRGHAVDLAGVTDGAGTRGLELMAYFVRQPGDGGIVERVRQFEAFIAAIRLDVLGLAIEIDRVFRIDLELLGKAEVVATEVDETVLEPRY